MCIKSSMCLNVCMIEFFVNETAAKLHLYAWSSQFWGLWEMQQIEIFSSPESNKN